MAHTLPAMVPLPPSPVPSLLLARAGSDDPLDERKAIKAGEGEVTLSPASQPSMHAGSLSPGNAGLSLAVMTPDEIVPPLSPAPSSLPAGSPVPFDPASLASSPVPHERTLAQPIPHQIHHRHRSLDELPTEYYAKLFGTTSSERRIRRTTRQDTTMLPTFARSVGAELLETYCEPRWLAMGGEAQLAGTARVDAFEETGWRRLTPLQEESGEERSSIGTRTEVESLDLDVGAEAAAANVADAPAVDAVVDAQAASVQPEADEDDDGYETIVNSPIEGATGIPVHIAPDLPALVRTETRKGKARASTSRTAMPDTRGRSNSKTGVSRKQQKQPETSSDSSSDGVAAQGIPRSPTLQQMIARMPPLTRQPRRESERPVSPLDFSKRPIPVQWHAQQRAEAPAPALAPGADSTEAVPKRQTPPPALRRAHSSPPPIARDEAPRLGYGPSAPTMLPQLPHAFRRAKRDRARTSVTRYPGDSASQQICRPELRERQLALELVRAMHASRVNAGETNESELESTDTDGEGPSNPDKDAAKRAAQSGEQIISDEAGSSSGDPYRRAMPTLPSLETSQTSHPESQVLITPVSERRDTDGSANGLHLNLTPSLQPIEETASQGDLADTSIDECDGATMLLPDSSGSTSTPTMTPEPGQSSRLDAFGPLGSEAGSVKAPATSFYASLARRVGSLATTVKQMTIRVDRKSASSSDLQHVVERPVEVPSEEDSRRLPHGAVGWVKIKDLWKLDSMSAECDLLGCHSAFTLSNRRHHCRSCGGIFCLEHSNYQLPLAVPADISKLQNGPVVQALRVCKLCWDIVFNPAGGADSERWSNGNRSSSEDVRGGRERRIQGYASDTEGSIAAQRRNRGSSLSARGKQDPTMVTLGSELFNPRGARPRRAPLGRYQTEPSFSHRLPRDPTRMTFKEARHADPASARIYSAELADYPAMCPRRDNRTNYAISPSFSPTSPNSRVGSLLGSRVGSMQSLGALISPSSSQLQLSRTASQSPLRSPGGLLTPPPVIDENGQLSITNLISSEHEFTSASLGLTQDQHAHYDSSDDDMVECLRMRQLAKRRDTSVLVVDGDIRYRANLPGGSEPEPEVQSGPRRNIFPEITF